MLLSQGFARTQHACGQVHHRRSATLSCCRTSQTRVQASRGGSGRNVDGSPPNDDEDDDGGVPEKVDIDQLAKRLSEEAEKLRMREADGTGAALADSGFVTKEGMDEGGGNSESSPLKPQSRDIEYVLLMDIGEGGFCADEFELIQQLGYLTIQAFQPRGSILENSQVTKEKKAVIAFVARYYSCRPYEFPITTLLKEYLPVAEEAARNELSIMMELCGLPETKWENLQNSEKYPPVVRLLGYFLASPSESATKSAMDPEDVAVVDTKGRSVWLVYRWEKLKPLSGFWEFDQAASQPTWPWQKPKESVMDLRKNMLRSIFYWLLDSLDYCHSRNVVHGSLGSGSVLLSTYDARDAKEVSVKLDNFGFARFIDGSQSFTGKGSPYYPDLRAAALLMFETCILSLSHKESLQSVTPESMERLVMDVFREDLAGLKQYCENEADWSEAVSFLEADDGVGWALVNDLLEGNQTAADALKSPFFKNT